MKDNYTLPKMDHILQQVVGAELISMLDGFSRYNQIKVLPEDQEKTTFTTPWGTLGHLYVCKDAFRPNECRSYFPASYGH